MQVVNLLVISLFKKGLMVENLLLHMSADHLGDMSINIQFLSKNIRLLLNVSKHTKSTYLTKNSLILLITKFKGGCILLKIHSQDLADGQFNYKYISMVLFISRIWFI